MWFGETIPQVIGNVRGGVHERRCVTNVDKGDEMVGIIRHEALSSRDVVDIGQSRYSSGWALHNGHIQVTGLTIAHSLCLSPLLSHTLSQVDVDAGGDAASSSTRALPHSRF